MQLAEGPKCYGNNIEKEDSYSRIQNVKNMLWGKRNIALYKSVKDILSEYIYFQMQFNRRSKRVYFI